MKRDVIMQEYLKMVSVPKFLYHATYKPLLRNIKKKGLGNTKRKFWQDSVPGVVYLADDPDVAQSYAESADELPNDDWYDEIIVLKINTNDLDQSKLQIDQNVRLDEGEQPHTYQYHGIITNFQVI